MAPHREESTIFYYKTKEREQIKTVFALTVDKDMFYMTDGEEEIGRTTRTLNRLREEIDSST
jgi:hypothetical protein